MSCSEATPPRIHDLVNSSGFAARALQVIEEIPRIGHNAGIVDTLRRAARSLGAEHAAFVSFVRGHDTAESFRFLLACDPVWCLEYQKQGWFAHDPWLLYAEKNSEPTCASRIPIRTSGQESVVGLAAKYGVASAYIVPAPACGGVSRLGVLMLGSGHSGFYEDPASAPVRVLARSLAMELHEWWVRKARRDIIEGYRLTSVDMQLLSLVRHGLGSKQIAEQLSISRGAVDSRFQRLCAKFNQPTRRATAHLAAEYGVI